MLYESFYKYYFLLFGNFAIFVICFIYSGVCVCVMCLGVDKVCGLFSFSLIEFRFFFLVDGE